MLITASGGARGKKQVLLKEIADKGVKLAAEGGFKVTAKVLHCLCSPEKTHSSYGWYLNWYQEPSPHTHTHAANQPPLAKTPIYSQA